MWIKIESPNLVTYLKEESIVSIDTPGKDGPPSGWEECAAAVGIRGQTEALFLGEQQWESLRKQLGLDGEQQPTTGGRTDGNFTKSL